MHLHLKYIYIAGESDFHVLVCLDESNVVCIRLSQKNFLKKISPLEEE